jgi:hypothetical protein
MSELTYGSDDTRESKEWSQMWKVKAPSKIKIFLLLLEKFFFFYQHLTFFITKTCQPLVIVLYVGQVIPGFTLCWNVPWLGVFGRWKMKKLSSISCQQLNLVRGAGYYP